MSTWLLGYVGLAKPYRFERLLCALAAALLALLLAISIVGCLMTGELIRYTPRDSYFLYLAILVVAGLALAPLPRLAAIVLALATVDLALGMGSLVLYKTGLAYQSIAPPNFNFDRRFQWHPLLQGTPIPGMSVDVAGARVSHSREGTRGRDYASDELKAKSVIAVFGGSATYDIFVGDGDTWPTRLEAALGSGFAVVNRGVPGYSTVEHVVQTAFYEDAFGVRPRCALYFIGWNDIRSAHIGAIDPGYAGFHLPSQLDTLDVRRFGGTYGSISPLLTLVLRVAATRLETIRPPRAIEGTPQPGSDAVLEALYLQNVRTISAINRSRGVRSIWVGQILNISVLNDDRVDGWLPQVRNQDVWPLLSRFNDILRAEASALGDAYIDVRPQGFAPTDFRDNGHFVASGSRKFAALLAPIVARECR